ncbi:uncharacterized protein QC763_504075 [Podospora pseudopauciseta]|uniref:Uncharacterized protein n=1 Tax=Podospora pseudopauciseta TaxID=2093780 RepID=A0ABR0H8B3_9PEZI|nr:hypothetical protein QC763_504075 [Podospora pseudopauciseta]
MKYTMAIIAIIGLTNAIAMSKEASNRVNGLEARFARQPGFITVVKKRSDDPGPSRLPPSNGKGREVDDPVLDQLREQEEAYASEDSSSGKSRGDTVTPPTSEGEGTRSPSPEGMQPWRPEENGEGPGSPTIPAFANSENRGAEEDPYGWEAHADRVSEERERENPFGEFPRYDVNER